MSLRAITQDDMRIVADRDEEMRPAVDALQAEAYKHSAGARTKPMHTCDWERLKKDSAVVVDAGIEGTISPNSFTTTPKRSLVHPLSFHIAYLP